MDLRFVAPSLRRLDLSGTEVLVAGLIKGERPPQGVAGLVDWRLSGRISQLIQSGFADGELGDVLLVPGKPKLPFDKLVFFGVGAANEFDERVYRLVLEKVLKTLEGLRARRAVVELPGRSAELITAERAASLLLDLTEARLEHDSWTLVETAEGQRSIQKLLMRDRRRRE